MRQLVQASVAVLAQLRSVIETLDDSFWNRRAPGTNELRIGPHVRHAIEFYECFLEGLRRGDVDYDSRRRNSAVENYRRVGVCALDALIAELGALLAVDGESALMVRSEELMLGSTVGRELDALLHHTIHHMALIAIALNAFGVAVPPEFGVSPATLRYRRQQTEAAA